VSGEEQLVNDVPKAFVDKGLVQDEKRRKHGCMKDDYIRCGIHSSPQTNPRTFDNIHCLR
jgi:hypothetical protein